MGKVINRVSFASAQRSGLLKPIIYCGDFADKGQDAESINIELAKELEALRPKRRTMQLEACFNRVLDGLPDNVVIKDFDVIFNPAYKVDVLKINEETLQTAVVKAINELLANKEPFLSTLQKNIATVFNEENDNATDDIEGKLEELQQQLLIQAKSKNDYEDVADEIYRLRELKQNALAENAEREGKRQRIAEMTDFLNEQSCELEEYDEQLVRRLIEKVTVFDDKLTVEFKSGVEIDIEI